MGICVCARACVCMQKNKMKEVFFVLFINILFPVDQCNSDMSVFTEFTDFLLDFFKKKVSPALG